MATAAQKDSNYRTAREVERWQARRRWARAGIVYTVMLLFSILFLGPLLFAAISSLEEDPLEYPPTLAIPQLSPRNWSAAANLGRAGAGAPLWGGFAPGADVPFEVRYFVPDGLEAEAPAVTVPRRRPGGVWAQSSRSSTPPTTPPFQT